MTMKQNITRRTFSKTAAAAGLSLSAMPISQARAEYVDGLYENIPVEDEIMGDPNAATTLLEYASMTCPHCKAFHENILPAIKKQFVDTGKVKYIVRPFPFDGDRRGEAAFVLAKCAPNNNYYPMIDALFATQPVWSRGPNPVGELLRIAKLAGMSEAEFKACLGDNVLLGKIIAGKNLAVRKFKVRATPTLFINSNRFTQPTTVANLTAALEQTVGG